MSYPSNLSKVATGTLTSATAGSPIIVHGQFNFTLFETFTGSAFLERSFDGVNFVPMTALGTPIVFSGPCTEIFSEPEEGVVWRVRCDSYTNGAISYRISQ